MPQHCAFHGMGDGPTRLPTFSPVERRIRPEYSVRETESPNDGQQAADGTRIGRCVGRRSFGRTRVLQRGLKLLLAACALGGLLHGPNLRLSELQIGRK